MRIFILLVTIQFLHYCCTAQENTSQATPEQLFLQYKKELADFEKSRGHFIRTPNVNMHYLTWGDPAGIPIVWSHGTFSNGYELFDVADKLVKAGYYIIAIDYYGHGLTPVPSKEVSLYHVADDIKYLLDHLGIKKAVIGGWSRGGSIATAFYDAYPAYVAGLVLEDGGSVAWDVNGHKKPVDSLVKDIEDMYEKYMPRATLYNSEQEFFNRAYERTGKNPAFKRILFTYTTMLKQDTAGKWLTNPYVNELVSQSTSAQLLTAIHRPFAANSLFGASSHLLYPRIIYRNLDIPMLIFDPVSNEDEFDFEQENALLQKAHPSFVTHKVYNNTGHAVKFNCPAEFVQDMISFIKKVSLR